MQYITRFRVYNGWRGNAVEPFGLPIDFIKRVCRLLYDSPFAFPYYILRSTKVTADSSEAVFKPELFTSFTNDGLCLWSNPLGPAYILCASALCGMHDVLPVSVSCTKKYLESLRAQPVSSLCCPTYAQRFRTVNHIPFVTGIIT